MRKGIQLLRLMNGARETIENISVRAVFFCQTLAHDLDHHLIRHQFAGIDERLCFKADFRLFLDGFAQNIPGRNLRNAQLLNQHLSMCALARTRRA